MPPTTLHACIQLIDHATSGFVFAYKSFDNMHKLLSVTAQHCAATSCHCPRTHPSLVIGHWSSPARVLASTYLGIVANHSIPRVVC